MTFHNNVKCNTVTLFSLNLALSEVSIMYDWKESVSHDVTGEFVP